MRNEIAAKCSIGEVLHRARRRYTVEGPLPPIVCPVRADALRVVLQLIPGRAKADALQESWVAFLSGKDPARWVRAWWARERRVEIREVSGGSDAGNGSDGDDYGSGSVAREG